MYKKLHKLLVVPRQYKKLLLVMKLTALLLFVLFMQVSAKTSAQKVTLYVHDTPLSAVFDQISKQTGYDFLYTNHILDDTKPVTITVKNEELSDVLHKIFEGQPLEFSIENKSVVISKKTESLIDNFKDKLKNALNLNQIDVTGTVLDEQGRTVPGATATVKGSGNAAITDAKGQFQLKNVPDNATIVISFIGYVKQELPAKSDMGKIKLVVATNQLDAVEVQAYGKTSQRLTTGNINTVSAEEIERQPVNNPLLALQGKVPGLFIAQTNGAPGSPITIQIQGQNSIQNGNDPLYVIDGVPYNSETLSVSLNSFGGQTNPLSYINPSDIESISILKDGEATSIYGSRAANGAILITTKKGKAGATKTEFSYQDGFSRDTRILPVLNTQQYIAMREMADRNDGIIPSANPSDPNYAPDLTLYSQTRYTNWQKVLLGGLGQNINVNGSVSGGSENSQFLVSGTYNKVNSIYPGDYNDQNAAVHMNLSNTSPNKKLKTDFSVNYSYNNNSLPGTDLSEIASRLPPNSPSLYNADGSLNWAPNSTGTSTWFTGVNPLAYTLNTYDAKTNNLVASGTVSYNILPGLNILSTFGYTYQQTYTVTTNPLSALAPQNRTYSQNLAQYQNSNINSSNIEPELNYKLVLFKGTLDALIGGTFHQDQGMSQSVDGQGYPSDLNLEDLGSASTIFGQSSSEYLYKYDAIFSRLNYNLNDEYLLDLSARRDGSSRFGSANQFHDFASAGAAWIFSKENIIQNNLSWLSFGKLKASYGTTGNDQIGNYQTLSTYSTTGNLYQGGNSLNPTGLANPFLQWELTKKINAGIDLGFLKDRVLIAANYFYNRSSNQLLGYSLPVTTGFGNIAENFPATVQNSGLELTLNTKNIQAKDFSWTTSANITTPHNELAAFTGLAQSSYASQYIIGQSISITHVTHFLGVDPATGVYQFEGNNGQATSNPNGETDKYIIENTLPEFYGGIENTFRYQGFELDIAFNFTKQNVSNSIFGFGERVGSQYAGNQPDYVLSAWQKPGDIASIRGYSTEFAALINGLNAGGSNAAYSNIIYFRLTNASLAWQLPKKWCQKILFQDIRLFARGQDLLTFSNYKGLDPETHQGVFPGTPPLTILVLGIKATL